MGIIIDKYLFLHEKELFQQTALVAVFAYIRPFSDSNTSPYLQGDFMKIITLEQESKEWSDCLAETNLSTQIPDIISADTPTSEDAFLTTAERWLIAKMKVEQAQAELDAIAADLLELAPQGRRGNGVIVTVFNRNGATKWADVSKQLMAVAKICDGGSANAIKIADQLTDVLFNQLSLDTPEQLDRSELWEAISFVARTLLPSDPIEVIKTQVVSLLMQKHAFSESIAVRLFEDISASTHISSDLIGKLVVRHTGAPGASTSIKLASDAQDVYARILGEKNLTSGKLPDIESAKSVANSNW